MAQFIEYLRNPKDFEESAEDDKQAEEEEKIKMPDIPRILREERGILSGLMKSAKQKFRRKKP